MNPFVKDLVSIVGYSPGYVACVGDRVQARGFVKSDFRQLEKQKWGYLGVVCPEKCPLRTTPVYVHLGSMAIVRPFWLTGTSDDIPVNETPF